MGNNSSQKRVTEKDHASLSQDTMDRLAELVAAKLRAEKPYYMLPKYHVAGLTIAKLLSFYPPIYIRLLNPA
jgi:hypothetical protein